MKRRGFTLIELLVVISIISILAALLFPVFTQIRRKGQQTVCLSNLRQLGVAISLYAQDYDQYLPRGVDAFDRVPHAWEYTSGGQFKTEVLQLPFLCTIIDPYLKSKEVWDCPADAGLDYSDAGLGAVPLKAYPSLFATSGMSYSYRTELGLRHKINDLTGYDPDIPGREYGPSAINVLFDSKGSWHSGVGTERRFNTLMGDGHTVSLTYDALLTAWAIRLVPSKTPNTSPPPSL